MPAAKRSLTRRLIRYVGFGLLNLVVLLVVVALVAPLLFDPNDYKDEIAEQVKARTGRDVTITGDMRFSVLPWLGVTVGEVSMGDAAGFGDGVFARVQGADVRVKLVPLLRREVEMDTVGVRGLELNLARDASGRGNWEDLAAAGAKAEAGDESRALAAFALGGVRLEDATVRYRDAATGEQITLSDLDLKTGAISLGDPVDAELSLAFAHPQGTGKLSGSTRVRYDLAAKRFGAEELNLSTEATLPALGQQPARGQLTGTLEYDASGARLGARGIRLGVDAPLPTQTGLTGPLALELGGDVELSLDAGTVASSGLTLRVAPLGMRDMTVGASVATALAANLATGEITLQGLSANADLGGGAVGGQPLAVRLAGDVIADLNKRRVDLTALRVEAADVKASGELQVTELGPAPKVAGKLAAPTFALRPLLARFGVSLPKTRDEKALGQAALRTGFQSDGKTIRLAPLELELDGARIEGELRAAPGGALAFDLAADRLDVDRYLPPAAAGAPPPAAAAAVPVDTLRALDVDGKLRVGALRYGGVDLTKVSLGIKAKGGEVRLDPLDASLFSGRYQGDIRIDARGDTPRMTLNERVTEVDAAALLAALGIDTGALDLRDGRTSLALKANVATDARGQRVLVNGMDLRGQVAGRSFRGGPAPVALSGNVALDLGARTAELDGVKAAFAELGIATSAKVGFAPGAPTYAGRVSVTPFNARSLAARLNLPLPPTADRAAFSRVGGSASVEGTRDRFKASGMTLELDDSRMSGDLAVSNFARPAFAFQLSVDRLDVDRYLPPAAKGKAGTPGAAATALPVDLVRSLNLDGQLVVGALKAGGVSMSDVKVTAVAKDGQLKMSPLAAALYGGRYSGNVGVDARQSVPRLTLDETIEGVQIGQLLRDVTGDSPVTGATDLRAVLTASGGDAEAIKRSLDGDVRFAVRNGTLKKIDMVSSMCTTLASVDFDNLNRRTIAAGVVGLLLNTQKRGGAAGSAGGDGTGTEFTEMSGSARLQNGVARNEDLILTSPVVRVRGVGAVNLPAEQIDYRAEAELVQSCAGIGQRDLAGHVIPVTVTGPIANPKVTPTIPVGLIRALRERRGTQAAPQAPAPAPQVGEAPPPPAAQPAPAPPPATPEEAIKQKGEQVLQDLLKGILKKR